MTPRSRLAVGFAVGVVAALALVVVIPLLAGLRPAIVTSASMTPALHPGDVVYTTSSPPMPGQIVVMTTPRGSLTHRVVAVTSESVTTRGDANPTADEKPAPTADITGVVVLVLPRVGLLALHPWALGVAGVAVALLTVAWCRPPRRQTVRLVGAAATLAVVSAGLPNHVPTAAAAFSANTALPASSWSSVLDPSTLPTSLSLGAVGTVNAVAVDAGVLYVGGDFVTIGGQSRNRLAAIDIASDTVLPWNPDINGQVLALSVSGGVVYAGGTFTTVNGSTARANIAAFPTATGVNSQATSWNPGASATVRAIAVDDTTSIVYAGGDFTTFGGATRNRAAAATAAGVLTAWDPNANGAVNALALTSTSVLLGGAFTTIAASTTRNRLAAVNLTTGAGRTWNPNLNNVLNAMVVDVSADTVYIGGGFTTVGGNSRSRLAAVSLTSGQASNWAPAPNSTVSALALDPVQQAVYVGGSFTVVGNQSRGRVAAVSTITGIGLPWDLDADGPTLALAFDATRSAVVAGGSFTWIGGADRQGLTMASGVNFTNGDVALPSTLDVGTVGTVRAMARNGSTLYIGGDFTWVNGSRRQHLAAVDLNTGALLAWAPAVDGIVQALVVNATSGVVYVGGQFLNSGTTTRTRLAAFASDGSLTSWAPGADNTVRAIVADWTAGLLYVAGDFATIAGQSRGRIAAVSTDGILTSFDGKITSSAVNTLALDTATSTLYFGGTFTAVNSVARLRAAAYSLTTATLTAFDPQLGSTVNAIAVDSGASTVYLGGTFTTVNTTVTRNRLASVSATTGVATAWDPSASNTVYALMLDTASSTLLVGGDYATIVGTARSRLAAFTTTTGALTSWNPSANSSVFVISAGAAAGQALIGGVFTTMSAAAREGLALLTGGFAATPTVATLTILPAGNAGTVNETVLVGSVLYLVGTFTYVSGAKRNRAAAVDLATDSVVSWDPNLNNTGNTIAYDPATSAVYIGGTFTTVNGATSRPYVAAFPASPTSATTLTWNPAVNASVNAITVQDNVIYLGGSFTTVNSGTARVGAVAVPAAPATATATAWNPGITGTVNDFAVDSGTGTIYAVGSFTLVNGSTTRNRAAAFPLSPSTATATSWDPDLNNAANAVVVDPATGTVHIGGTFTAVNAATATRNRLAAFPPSPGPATATSWDPNANGTVTTLTVDTNNALVYAGGSFGTLKGLTRGRVAAIALDSVGSVFTWAPNPSSTVSAIVVDPTNDNPIVAGTFTRISLVERGSLAAFEGAVASTPPTYLLAARVVVGAGSPSVLASVVSGTTAVFAGDFTSVGGAPRRRVATVDLTTLQLIPSRSIGTGATVRALAVDGTQLYAGGDFTGATGSAATRMVTRNRLAAWTISSGTLSTWDPNANNVVWTIAVASSGTVYVGGQFTTIVGNTARSRVAALSGAPGSAVATPWNPNANSTVQTIGLDEARSVVYLGGTFVTLGGSTTRNRVAAVAASPATGSATTWDPNAGAAVRALAVDSAGTVYIVGDFTTIAGVARNRAAAITAAGAVTGFDPNLSGTSATAVTVEPGASRVYLGGDFTTVGATSRSRIASVDAGTGAATAWSPDASAGVQSISFSVPNKRLLIGGTFTTVTGATSRGLAVL